MSNFELILIQNRNLSFQGIISQRKVKNFFKNFSTRYQIRGLLVYSQLIYVYSDKIKFCLQTSLREKFRKFSELYS